MKDNADDSVIGRLRGAIESDALPKAARDYAEHLLKRLSSPVRVSLLGAPGSGKSELVNMFTGRRVIPKGARLPTAEFVYGPAEAISVHGIDGRVARREGIDFGGIDRRQAALIRVELPVPILERISLLEVVTEGGRQELSSATDWAVRRTDIALWCTQSFDETERAVWTRVPDSLKDHAFLVLTKADVLSSERLLSQRVAELETIVAEEFHSLFAVATLQAIKAHRAGGGLDEALYHASGGGALTAEVLRHAERGRRADFDSVHMFLARYHVRSDGRAHAPVSRPIPAEPPPPPQAAEPAAETAAPVRAAPAQAAEPAVEKAAPVRAAPAPAEKRPEVTNPEIFADAVRFLRRRADGLADTVASLGEGHTEDLVGQCVNAVEHLVDLFSQDDSGCEAADAFIDELAEAADMMILMQVEKGDGPAADAVTLLLQLRRDMEMQLAA